jgi:two-component system sensor histidine kinase/response regulator
MGKLEAALKVSKCLMRMPCAGLVFQDGSVLYSGEVSGLKWADFSRGLSYSQLLSSSRFLDVQNAPSVPLAFSNFPCLSSVIVEPLASDGASLFFLSDELCSLDTECLEEHIATLAGLFSSLLPPVLSEPDVGQALISYEDLIRLNNNVPVLIALVNKDLRYEFINDTYEQRFSILKDEVVGRHVKEHIPFDSNSTIKARLEEALQGKSSRFHYEVRQGVNNELRSIGAYCMPRIDQGEVTGLYLCMQDVTAQRGTLHTLKCLHEVTANTCLSLDEKLQRILQVGAEQFALPIGLISSIEGESYRVEYSHTPNGEVLPGAIFDLGNTYCVHTLESDLPTSYFHTAISDIKEHPCYQNFGLEAYIGIVVYVGGKRWGTLNFSSPNPKQKAFGDDDYEVMKLLAQWVGNEITRQQGEVKLTTAERQQRLILEAIHEGIFGVNNEGVITFANSAACKILDYSLDELLNNTLFSLLSHRDENGALYPLELSPIHKTLKTGESSQARGEYFGRKDDVSFVCEYTCIAMRSEQGYVEGAVISFQDRTEQMEAEGEFHEQKMLFESLFLNAPEAIVMVGSDRKIKMINPAFTELFGYDLDDVLEESTKMLYANESDFIKRGSAYGDDRESVLSRYRVSYKSKQGRIIHTETIGSMVPNPDGSLGGFIAHIRDVSERLEVEQKMIDTNLRLSIAADAAGIGVWELDLADHTLHWDDWMYRLYSSSKEEGESPFQIWEACVFPEDKARLEDVLALLEKDVVNGKREGSAFSISQFLDTDFRIVRQDGQNRYLKSNAAIVFDKDGRPSRLLGVNMDITSGKETEVILREASKQAVAASKAKSDFLATMSHEIRTPLNGVLGMAELLSSTRLDSEQNEQLRILKESGESLLSLINDLLDFSKIEAGHLSIEKVDFDLEKSIYDVARLLMVRAEEKGIDLLIEYDDCPRFLVGDVFRIKQILINLMSNAIKFTNVGHVLVSTKGVVNQQGVVSVTINVTDTGVGVAKDAQSCLFDAFVQADSSTTRKFGGTGLGLAITKQLIGLMHGDITLLSELGVGSTFTVHFTLPESHAMPKIETVVNESMLVGKKALVVDDNETNLTILRNQLKSCGIDADIDISPVDALCHIKQAIDSGSPYDIVVLDYMMPELDGLMLAKLIRVESKSMVQPILLMTSSAGVLSQEELSIAGINVCIAKPMGRTSLKKGLISALSSGSIGQQFSSGELSRLDSKEGESSACDLRKGVILVVEDMKANMAVAKGILVRMGFEVIEAEDGAIGIKKWEAHNPDLIFMDLHMPVMDGLSAMRRIRQIEKNGYNKRVPIVALTADIMPATLSEVRRAGGDGLVPKPFKQKELIEMLDKWLSVDQSSVVVSEDKSEPLVTSVFDAQSNVVIDESVLNDLKAILGDDYLLLIDAFFSDADSLIDAFNKMIEKGDISDYTSVSQLSHSLKSISQNVGAMTLSSMAAQLELESRQGDVPKLQAKLGALIVMYQNVKNELQRIAAGL